MPPTQIYKDKLCYAAINDSPITLGHIRVYPNKPVEQIEDLSEDESAHIFKVASMCATMLFEGMKTQGTNIICQNNKGQNPHIEVIARFENDNLGMFWEPKQGNPQEVADLAGKMQGNIVESDPVKNSPIEAPSANEIKPKSNGIDYRIEHLIRRE